MHIVRCDDPSYLSFARQLLRSLSGVKNGTVTKLVSDATVTVKKVFGHEYVTITRDLLSIRSLTPGDFTHDGLRLRRVGGVIYGDNLTYWANIDNARRALYANWPEYIQGGAQTQSFRATLPSPNGALRLRITRTKTTSAQGSAVVVDWVDKANKIVFTHPTPELMVTRYGTDGMSIDNLSVSGCILPILAESNEGVVEYFDATANTTLKARGLNAEWYNVTSNSITRAVLVSPDDLRAKNLIQQNAKYNRYGEYRTPTSHSVTEERPKDSVLRSVIDGYTGERTILFKTFNIFSDTVRDIMSVDEASFTHKGVVTDKLNYVKITSSLVIRMSSGGDLLYRDGAGYGWYNDLTVYWGRHYTVDIAFTSHDISSYKVLALHATNNSVYCVLSKKTFTHSLFNTGDGVDCSYKTSCVDTIILKVFNINGVLKNEYTLHESDSYDVTISNVLYEKNTELVKSNRIYIEEYEPNGSAPGLFALAKFVGDKVPFTTLPGTGFGVKIKHSTDFKAALLISAEAQPRVFVVQSGTDNQMASMYNLVSSTKNPKIKEYVKTVYWSGKTTLKNGHNAVIPPPLVTTSGEETSIWYDMAYADNYFGNGISQGKTAYLLGSHYIYEVDKIPKITRLNRYNGSVLELYYGFDVKPSAAKSALALDGIVSKVFTKVTGEFNFTSISPVDSSTNEPITFTFLTT